MSRRVAVVFLSLILLFAPQIHAKNKKKQLLPDYVLRAQYVLIVIPPDAGEALTNPRENRTAQDDVERAMVKWGRFRLATNPQDADLIIAVRKGNKSGPIISHSPVDNRPDIFRPGIADASVGPEPPHGPPNLTQPVPGGYGNRGPQLGNQIGSSEDTFEVYMGRGEYPLDAPALALHRERFAERAASRRGRAIPQGH